MRTLFKLIILPALLYSGLLLSSEYDWKKVMDQSGVQVYTRQYLNNDIKSFKGTIGINASIDSILAVIMDFDACNKWIHHCKQSTLLLRKSFSECYHHQVQTFPFLIQNRHFILHSKTIYFPKSGNILIRMNAITDFCVNNKSRCRNIGKTDHLIRIKHSHGYYLLESLHDNISRVTWVQHTDPEGDLPIWLVNQMITTMPYKTLLGLKKEVFEDKYQKKKLLINHEGKMIGFKSQIELK